MTGPAGPLRAGVAGIYDRGAAAYQALWSPVILPPAAALIRSLGLHGRCVVADVGAGTGALLDAIRAAAPAARVVALDASAGMLHLARTRDGAAAVLADALALPLAGQAADAVILAYVLFHLADPARAVAEAARVLRPGGRAGTSTWAWERGPHASAVWDQVLADAGAPPAPLRRADAGLDRPSAVAALLSSAGLRSTRIWTERLQHQWNRTSFWELASGSGPTGIRLSRLRPAARADVLARTKSILGQLAPQDFLWEGEVICAVATKNANPQDSGRRAGGRLSTAVATDDHVADPRAPGDRLADADPGLGEVYRSRLDDGRFRQTIERGRRPGVTPVTRLRQPAAFPAQGLSPERLR